VKIRETIKRLFRRRPPPTREELAAHAEAERQLDRDRQNALIEAEKLRATEGFHF
jgi:hypothetical protein